MYEEVIEDLYTVHIYQFDSYIETYNDIDIIITDDIGVLIGNSESGITLFFPKSKGYNAVFLFKGEVNEK